MPEPDSLTPEQRSDLARCRLEQETRRHEVEQEQETKRIESRWAAYKAVGVTLSGTAAVGIIGALLSWHIKTTELALEKEKTLREADAAQRVQEQNYLQNFVADALNEDIQRRIDFAQYVGSVTLNYEMRKLWSEYHKALEQELTDTRKDLLEQIAERDKQRKLADQASKSTIEELNNSIAILRNRLSSQANAIDNQEALVFRITRSLEQITLIVTQAEKITGPGSANLTIIKCTFELPIVGTETNANNCELPRLSIPAPVTPYLTRTEPSKFELAYPYNVGLAPPLVFELNANEEIVISSRATNQYDLARLARIISRKSTSGADEN